MQKNPLYLQTNEDPLTSIGKISIKGNTQEHPGFTYKLGDKDTKMNAIILALSFMERTRKGIMQLKK